MHEDVLCVPGQLPAELTPDEAESRLCLMMAMIAEQHRQNLGTQVRICNRHDVILAELDHESPTLGSDPCIG